MEVDLDTLTPSTPMKKIFTTKDMAGALSILRANKIRTFGEFITIFAREHNEDISKSQIIDRILVKNFPRMAILPRIIFMDFACRALKIN